MLRAAGKRVPARYRTQARPKRDGGTRTLAVPPQAIKRLQDKIGRRLVRTHWRVPVGVGPRDQATFVLEHTFGDDHASLDINAAFPSTTQPMVTLALVNRGLDMDAARFVVRICCLGNELPQGSPSSPPLLDLVLAPVDRHLKKRATREATVYGRWVDNLYFSGRTGVSALAREARARLNQLGYRIPRDRLRGLMADGSREVLGCLVSRDGARVGEHKVRELFERLSTLAPGDSASTLDASTRGLLAYVRRINPLQASRILAAAGQPEDLGMG